MVRINWLAGIPFVFLMLWCADIRYAAAVECSHSALAIASEALQTSDTVEVSIVEVDSWDGTTPAESDDNIYYVFTPINTPPETAFIFLPGGNSDPVAYAPAAHRIASNGFLTIILPMPDCVAMPNGQKRADIILADYPEIEKRAIGGHSVGAVSACLYAKYNGVIDGVVIWASIPPNNLARTDLSVISIYGTEDGRLDTETVESFASLLPADTIYVEIEGGNHTQFAYYDTSPDDYLGEDKPATITLDAQQDIIVDATSDFLAEMSDRDRGGCLAVSLLGKDHPKLDSLRRFRDEVLRKSPWGEKLVGFYYGHEEPISSFLNRHALLKKSARKILEALADNL